MKAKQLILAAILIAATSCRSQRIIGDTGYVVTIDRTDNWLEIYWPCINNKYKNQPCGALSVHHLQDFPEAQLNDTLRLGPVNSYPYFRTQNQ